MKIMHISPIRRHPCFSELIEKQAQSPYITKGIDVPGLSREKQWEYSEELTSPGNGTWIEFPNGVRGAAVDLVITSGVGYVEATNGSLSEVKANTAIGTIWDKGQVSGTAQDYVIPVKAIRLVNVAGTVKINVTMQ